MAKIEIKQGMKVKLPNDNRIYTVCRVKKNGNNMTDFSLFDPTGCLLRTDRSVVRVWNLETVLEKNLMIIFGVNDSQYDKNNKNNNPIIQKQIKVCDKYFREKVLLNGKPFTLDKEQLRAVVSKKNTLVTARAGAGKTRVIVAKLIYLFELENLSSENVLTFCFNKDAKEEIAKRLKNECKIENKSKYDKIDVSKTFHSYAKSILERDIKPIDEKKSYLIKKIIRKIKETEQNFSDKVYKFFKEEFSRIDGVNHTKETYYKELKNSYYRTLNGEEVKSKAEKVIADYLFEHGIKYIYEKHFYPYKIDLEFENFSKEEQKDLQEILKYKKDTAPDFFLKENNIVWEHWGTDGKESWSEKKSFSADVCDYDIYEKGKEWKRLFWKQNWRKRLSNNNKNIIEIKSVDKLIETYNRDFENLSRENFLQIIEQMLKENNAYKELLPYQERLDIVWEKNIDAFTKLVVNFINKLQQNFFDNIQDFENSILKAEDEKTKIFYECAYKVYKEYVNVLGGKFISEEFEQFSLYNCDFNQIIFEASKKIREGKCDQEISKLKWLLIDEYQDFSRLFDYLIESIKMRNPDIKVFCVGDDWQAINRYAGSNLKYFQTFEKRYKDSELLNIKSNYRSGINIVQFSNQFMEREQIEGERIIPQAKNFGSVTEINIENTFVDYYHNPYEEILQLHKGKLILPSKYIETCKNIIKTNLDKEKIKILTRGNKIFGFELIEFYDILKKSCADIMEGKKFKEKIELKTVHTSKGEEGDVVILLGINKNKFPIFSTSNNLFKVFGEDSEDFYEDEKRLYYVALTRAKESLYILYEMQNASPFISDVSRVNRDIGNSLIDFSGALINKTLND